jgi:D-3-phosphoglycerate dehydrogenase
MLFVRCEDKPGIIGALGRTLGDAGVNMATFHLGRSRPGGDALALIEVDQPLSEDLLMAICALPHVTQCKALSF